MKHRGLRDGVRRVFRLPLRASDILHADADTELAAVVEARVEYFLARGMNAADARAEALKRLGIPLDTAREQLHHSVDQRERRMRLSELFDDLQQDVRYALRRLRRDAGLTMFAVLIVGLGVGASVTVFSIADALLLRPLPFRDAGRLVWIGNGGPTGTAGWNTQVDHFKDLVAQNKSFQQLGAYFGGFGVGGSNLTSPGEPERLSSVLVTQSFFPVLGVRPVLGRNFTDEESLGNGPRVALMSYGLWVRRFASDPGIVGRALTINGAPVTVVGVLPKAFDFGSVFAPGNHIDLFSPFPLIDATNRMGNTLVIVGRLKDGVTIGAATAEVKALGKQMSAAHPSPERNMFNPNVATLQQHVSGGLRSAMTLLAFAVGVLMLIVCANVANLMLGRATSRAREIGVRLALGAGRWRIVQQLMTESLLLALAGAALGLGLAHWSVVVLVRTLSGTGSQIPIDTELNATVLVFTAALAAGTALLFGLVPALRATRVDLASVLRAHSRGLTGGWRRLNMGRALVMLQVALSLTMLVATGMVVRSLRALETRDLGLDRTHLLITSVDGEKMQLSDSAFLALRTQLTTQLAALPGVGAVSYSTNGIFSGSESATDIVVPGFTERTEQDSTVNIDNVGPGYIRAIGGRLLGGRDIAEGDGTRSPNSAVVNAAFVAKYYPSGDPVGREFTRDGKDVRIVGVVANVQGQDLREPPSARFYSALGGGAPAFTFEVRTVGDPAQLVLPVQRLLKAAAPSLVIDDNESLPALTRESVRQDILMAQFVGGFGALALVLAAMGLYGIMSYVTLRRTGEFGLRMALGAQPGDIMRMVLGDGLFLIGVGVLLGVPLMLVGSRLLRSQLFGVRPFDPTSIVFAVAILAVSALVAGLFPARRAARVGPLAALQTE